jgi:Cu-Zn family superoxide dismutase
MKDARKLVVALLVVVAAGALAACGSSDGGTTEASGEESAPVTGQFAPVADAPAGDSKVDGEAELTRSNGGTTVSISVTGLEPKTKYIAHLHTGGCDQADPGGPHFQFKKGGSEEPPNEIHLEFTSNAAGEGEAEASSKREVPVGEAGSFVIHTAEGESHHEMAAYEPGEAETVTTLFVHEGEHHGDAPEHAHSEKIACAELEGAAASEGEATSGESGGDVPTIVIRDGEPVGGVQTLEFSAGEEIRFRVSSDAAEEVHVHGYDIAKEVPAGGTIEFDFSAELEGIYEAELEGLGVQIAELRVNP